MISKFSFLILLLTVAIAGVASKFFARQNGRGNKIMLSAFSPNGNRQFIRANSKRFAAAFGHFGGLNRFGSSSALVKQIIHPAVFYQNNDESKENSTEERDSSQTNYEYFD